MLNDNKKKLIKFLVSSFFILIFFVVVKNEVKAQTVGGGCAACNSCGSCNYGVYKAATWGGVFCSVTAPALPAGYGTACSSSANACGQKNSGTINCSGLCSAVTPSNSLCATACTVCNACGACATGWKSTTGWGAAGCSVSAPALPVNYGKSCNSPANSCGQTTAGTITCSGTCSATTPPPINPPNAGSYCQSGTNACGEYNTGSITCATAWGGGGVCSAPAPLPRTYVSKTVYTYPYGNACLSAANVCGAKNSGTITCTGACSASVPANPAGYGTTCQSVANACGIKGSGIIGCSGCTAVVPALPAGYGTACQSAPNACGARNSGTITCTGACSASTPANPAGYGTSCQSAANACGIIGSGTIGCSGCTATVPALPAGYNNPCISGSNICGMTNSGTIGCSGCNASTPAASLCPVIGECGPSDGRSFYTAPTSGLCNIGNPSEVVGELFGKFGPWNWTCSVDGGTSANCTALEKPLPFWMEVGR